VFKTRLTALLLVFLAGGCGPVGPFRPTFGTATPYQQYVNTLHDTGQDRSPIGAAWIDVGLRALRAPQAIKGSTPTEEVFSSSEPRAVAYRVPLRRGQRLLFNVTTESGEPVAIFADVFDTTALHSSLASIPIGGRQLLFEPHETGEFVVRIQPELLRGARLTLMPRVRAALLFPVDGHGRSSVQSLFAAARDGGAREHQGIDIFAPRGTRALAAASGLVTSTSPNRLGGTVVWVWDPLRGQTLYYAHLDSQAVRVGRWVSRGETVGYIGNTGNARTTGPHLHFGIYRQRMGPIDPLPYVVDPRNASHSTPRKPDKVTR
jgi:peptidoglycan LD-endopeptidase LytH